MQTPSDVDPRTAPHATARADHWAFNTTTRCQHRCVYCFEGARRGKRDLPLDESKRLLDEAARHVRWVIFMGAEPTLNPHILELTRYGTTELGLRISFATNGVKFAQREFLDACIDAGLKHIDFSFHYPDAEAYHAITRVPAGGFARLLRAFDTIEARNRECADDRDRFPVGLVTVVSRHNIARLPEVLAHATSRLRVTPLRFTLKRVTGLADDPDFTRRDHVPLAELRRQLGALGATALGDLPLEFRDFPLCALPGLEHRDADLGYWLQGVQVHDNFTDQAAMSCMYPWETARTTPRYDWVCTTCSLAPFCYSREVFRHDPLAPESCPVPHGGPLPRPLAEALRQSGRYAELAPPLRRLLDEGLAEPAPVPDIATLPTADTAWEARVLRALATSLPPGQPLAGEVGTWEPLDTGCFLLRGPDATVRLRLATPSEETPEGTSFVPVARLGLSGNLDEAPSLLPAVSALAQALGGLPALGEAPMAAPEGWLGAAWEAVAKGCAGSARATPGAPAAVCRVRVGEGRVVALDVREPFGRGTLRLALERPTRDGDAPSLALVALPGDPSEDVALRRRLAMLAPFGDPAWRSLAEALRERLAREPELGGVRFLGALSDQVMARLPDTTVGTCRLARLAETGTEGFLAGPLALQPDEALIRSSAGCAWLATVARTVAAIVPDPVPPFLAAVAGLGRAALPWCGPAGRVVAGSVLPGEVRLRIATASGATLELTLVPRATAVRPIAANDRIALCYRTDTPGSTDVRGILAHYAQRLR